MEKFDAHQVAEKIMEAIQKAYKELKTLHLSELSIKTDSLKGDGKGTARTAKGVHAGGHQGRTDTVFP